MHIVRYALNGDIHYGIIEEGGTIARLRHPPFESLERSGDTDPLQSARILAPVDQPRIFGVAYNYNDHTRESGKVVPDIPVLFMKPSTSVVGPEDSIQYPVGGEIVHFEGELVVIIGKQARYVSEDDALDYVLGYTCGNDVSDRVVQRRESSFGCLLAGKGYDTFAPIGPVIATGLDPANLSIVTRVNGAVRQDGSTANLLFSVRSIIAYLSRYMTLLPGDVIMTGTPSGVGPIQVGDTVEIEIPGIGVLRNDVVPEPSDKIMPLPKPNADATA
ncbi:fumarylacetoacetate hydrolase family protein [Microvirga zambiensis]|uniref:fumarylacetoacetate hydrolase family protein n=1 Tax=Microvirga zambiensis TaxID=1402137 RepID=UPI00191DE99C|nr:fumarylacetoacetate hydrolase family protein [Microvirga zambiensis]